MIKFRAGFGGVMAAIVTLGILYCIHFLLVLFLWKILMVELFALPMINVWQAFGIEILAKLFTKSMPIKIRFVKPFNVDEYLKYMEEADKDGEDDE